MERLPDLHQTSFVTEVHGDAYVALFVGGEPRWLLYSGTDCVGSFTERDGTFNDPWPTYVPERNGVQYPPVDDWRCAMEFLVREHTGRER
ncbi:hypothetical protein [Curtobacterium sp. MCBD17_040]|uniref:hypothetical protein n=1 Tax=Curtobacterium sp. MCBD17_040 TaxID=2175674 RepID=UPI000DA7D19A|nr:hypothetical protein [Curtobacterium sp. MCBD17_040]WIB65852.1 hypothetical protein DEI94_17205 [Curtobacterium sp. MCBD17_040]